MPKGYYVRKIKPFKETFEKRINRDSKTGCWLWTGQCDRQGYGVFRLKGSPYTTRIASRISWQIYNGPITDGLNVLHKCDTPPCVNPLHLFLGTIGDNYKDSKNKGRTGYGVTVGTNHPFSKLTEEQVYAIRNDLRSIRVIAGDYGICDTTVCKIKLRQKWRHLP